MGLKGGRERRGQGGGQDRREAESRGRQDRARPSLSREGGQADRRIRNSREEGRGDAGGDRDCIRRPHHSLCCHLLSTFETSQSFPPLPLQSILNTCRLSLPMSLVTHTRVHT